MTGEMATIGARIRAARQRKVWTQDDLSRQTAMPKASISRIENGQTTPHQSTIHKLAAALEVDPV